MGGRTSPLQRTEAALAARALAYPGSSEDFPWGERVVKVGKKVFVFLHLGSDALSVTFKLPGSAELALGLPFTEPTGYGLGRSGWVTSRFGSRERPPLELLLRWLDESYRAVAPKRQLRELDAPTPPRGGR